MPREVSHFQKALQKALQLGLFVGAARAACTPEEAVLLRQGLMGPLGDYRAGRYDEKDIIDIVRQIMPDDWQPAPEWAKALKDAGFTDRDSGK